MATELRRCTKCGVQYPPTTQYFSPRIDNRDGLRTTCRKCDCRRQRAVYAKDPSKQVERTRRYSDAHPERVAENTRRRSREWQRRNYDTHGREYNRRWRALNKDKTRTRNQRRTAQMRGFSATFTAEDWQSALDAFHGCCAYCGRPPGLWHILAQDHFIPLASGGVYTPGNIVPACHGDGGCNNRKSSREPHEWLAERFGKRKANEIASRISAYFTRVMEPDVH